MTVFNTSLGGRGSSSLHIAGWCCQVSFISWFMLVYVGILPATWGSYYITGWWFGTWCFFSIIYGRIIPTDFHIFQRGRSTTNQTNSILWLFSEGLKPPTSIGYVFTRVCTEIPMSFAADPAGIGRQDLHRRGWHRRYRRDAVPSRRQIEGATGLGAQGEVGGCWKVWLKKNNLFWSDSCFMSIW